jgi:outer membrane protein assembly factor BamB
MTVDADGYVYVTGTSATTGSNDWTTIKYNPAGAQEWLRTLNGGGSDAAFAITTDDAGNLYVTGSSGGGLYYLTAKYSATGDRLWVQSFADIGEGDAASDIAVDHDGNVYVTGYSVATLTGLDIVTIKYSPDGAELWVRRYDSGSGEGRARGNRLRRFRHLRDGPEQFRPLPRSSTTSGGAPAVGSGLTTADTVPIHPRQ